MCIDEYHRWVGCEWGWPSVPLSTRIVNICWGEMWRYTTVKRMRHGLVLHCSLCNDSPFWFSLLPASTNCSCAVTTSTIAVARVITSLVSLRPDRPYCSKLGNYSFAHNFHRRISSIDSTISATPIGRDREYFEELRPMNYCSWS